MDSTLKVIKDKKSKIEFEVKIDGADDLAAKTHARLIVHADKNYCLTLEAKRDDGDMWCIDVPANLQLDVGEYKVVLEVIVDNYLFESARGFLEVITEPQVDMTKKKEKKKIIEHSSAGSVNGGQPYVGTTLLKPEFDPTVPDGTTKKSKVQKSPEDEHVKIDDLADEVIPGEGEDYTQRGTFNAKDVAKRAILDVLGTNKVLNNRIKTGEDNRTSFPKQMDTNEDDQYLKGKDLDQEVRKILNSLK